MNGSHVAGGASSAGLAGLALALLRRYTWINLSDSDAALVGSGALAAGVAIGHAIGAYGIKGALRILWRGRPAPVAAPPVA